MPRETTFWRNVGIVCLLHIGLLAGLAKWSSRTNKATPADIVWMDGGALANVAATAASTAAPAIPPEPAPTVIPQPTPSEPEQTPEPAVPSLPAPTATASEIQPTPPATPKLTPTPTTPTPKPSPKPTPKATPTPTPKKKTPTPKPSPSASPKKTATPAEEKATATPKPKETPPAESPAGATANPGKTGTPGSGGQGSGSGSASQFAGYANKLHDRFFSEWVQPTSVVATGAKMAAQARVRIEKDGRVSSFEIVRASGNVVVDESVAAVAKRVTQVDPLPPGLGTAGHYDVKINFELNPEE